MITKINAFRRIFSAGQPARVSFNDEFAHVQGEPAAFVIEFMLDHEGKVSLRQAGASRREGLVLTGPRGRVNLRKGQVLELHAWRTLQEEKLFLPGSPAYLTFGTRGVDGEIFFNLSWRAEGAPPEGSGPTAADVRRKLQGGKPLSARESQLVASTPELAAMVARRGRLW